jgi:hypothetical protein
VKKNGQDDYVQVTYAYLEGFAFHLYVFKKHWDALINTGHIERALAKFDQKQMPRSQIQRQLRDDERAPELTLFAEGCSYAFRYGKLSREFK